MRDRVDLWHRPRLHKDTDAAHRCWRQVEARPRCVRHCHRDVVHSLTVAVRVASRRCVVPSPPTAVVLLTLSFRLLVSISRSEATATLSHAVIIIYYYCFIIIIITERFQEPCFRYWEFGYGKSPLTFSIHYQRKLGKWRIANVKSGVDVGDRLRDCRTENIHTRNTSVIAFSYAAVGLWYTVFFHFIHTNTLTCLATNLWRYLCASLVSFGSCGHVCSP